MEDDEICKTIDKNEDDLDRNNDGKQSNDTNTGIDDNIGLNDNVTKTQVHKEYETDSFKHPKPITSDESIIAEHSIIDEDGDLIMASIEALIDEQFTDSSNSDEKEKGLECFDSLVSSETVITKWIISKIYHSILQRALRLINFLFMHVVN